MVKVSKKDLYKLDDFYVCRKCGQTIKALIKPKKCKECSCKEIGEIKIEW